MQLPGAFSSSHPVPGLHLDVLTAIMSTGLGGWPPRRRPTFCSNSLTRARESTQLRLGRSLILTTSALKNDSRSVSRCLARNIDAADGWPNSPRDGWPPQT